MDRATWLATYHRFMIENGTRVERLPIFDREPLDIYRLYHAVIGRGGLESVTTQKLWRQVTQDLNVDPDRTDAGFRLRVHYTKYLYPFEAAFFHGTAARDTQLPPPPLLASLQRDARAATTSTTTPSSRSLLTMPTLKRSVVVTQSDGESNDDPPFYGDSAGLIAHVDSERLLADASKQQRSFAAAATATQTPSAFGGFGGGNAAISDLPTTQFGHASTSTRGPAAPRATSSTEPTFEPTNVFGRSAATSTLSRKRAKLTEMPVLHRSRPAQLSGQQSSILQEDIDDGDFRRKRLRQPYEGDFVNTANSNNTNDDDNNNDYSNSIGYEPRSGDYGSSGSSRSRADVDARRRVWLSLDNVTLQRYLASTADSRHASEQLASLTKRDAALLAIAQFEATYVSAADEQTIIDEFVWRARQHSLPPR